MRRRESGRSDCLLLRSQTCADALRLAITPPLVVLLPQNSQELTDVERAIEIVINNFHCYAVKGRKECITPNELRDLVGQRLPHLAEVKGAT